jgi:hypothetical protein
MVVILIIPIEEATAEGLRILDAAEPLRKLGSVVTRFLTYLVKLDAMCGAYCKTIMAMPEMIEWIDAAKQESDDIEELEIEF